MKTLIQTLFFSGKRKVVRRVRRVNAVEAVQIAKMGRLGQTLVVMSR